MKKLLPKFFSSSKGFTLIELMVTITIISILAVVGVVAYSGISARARDAKRITEIDAIHKALEKKYTTGYTALTGSDFANGSIPIDPRTGENKCGTAGDKTCMYCASANNGDTCSTAVSSSAPASGVTTYTICANLETGAGLSGARYYCKSNAQ